MTTPEICGVPSLASKRTHNHRRRCHFSTIRAKSTSCGLQAGRSTRLSDERHSADRKSPCRLLLMHSQKAVNVPKNDGFLKLRSKGSSFGRSVASVAPPKARNGRMSSRRSVVRAMTRQDNPRITPGIVGTSSGRQRRLQTCALRTNRPSSRTAVRQVAQA